MIGFYNNPLNRGLMSVCNPAEYEKPFRRITWRSELSVPAIATTTRIRQQFVRRLASPPAHFPLLRVYLFVSETGKSLSAKSQLLERARWILSLTLSSCAAPDITEAQRPQFFRSLSELQSKKQFITSIDREPNLKMWKTLQIYTSQTLLHVIMTFWSEGLFLNCRQSL